METKASPIKTQKFTVDDRMFDKFREIRKKVWFEATRNKPENKELLQKSVIEVADRANLDHWRASAPEVRSELWSQIVEKIFYSGFDASIVNAKLAHIQTQFGDYKSLCCSDWDIRLKGHRLSDTSGRFARAYFGNDRLEDKIRHAAKIRKIVVVARVFTKYFDEHSEALALSFVTRQNESEDVWQLSGNLDDVGLSGQLIQLHLMMDLGFDCIKPDIVISRLVLSLGWLAKFAERLPADLTEDDLRGKGKYGSKFHYTKIVVIKPIVDLARAFASKMRQERETLQADIGWVTSNPIREFDIFMVAFGQRPDPSWGIEVQLSAGNSHSKTQQCPAWKGGLT